MYTLLPCTLRVRQYTKCNILYTCINRIRWICSKENEPIQLAVIDETKSLKVFRIEVKEMVSLTTTLVGTLSLDAVKKELLKEGLEGM